MQKKDSRKAQRRVNLVASLLALALSIGIALNRGLSTALELYANCRILSDAFFISGIFFGGIGALVAISTTGFFCIRVCVQEPADAVLLPAQAQGSPDVL